MAARRQGPPRAERGRREDALWWGGCDFLKSPLDKEGESVVRTITRDPVGSRPVRRHRNSATVRLRSLAGSDPRQLESSRHFRATGTGSGRRCPESHAVWRSGAPFHIGRGPRGARRRLDTLRARPAVRSHDCGHGHGERRWDVPTPSVSGLRVRGRTVRRHLVPGSHGLTHRRRPQVSSVSSAPTRWWPSSRATPPPTRSAAPPAPAPLSIGSMQPRAAPW